MSELKIRRKTIARVKNPLPAPAECHFVVGMYGLVRMYGDCEVT